MGDDIRVVELTECSSLARQNKTIARITVQIIKIACARRKGFILMSDVMVISSPDSRSLPEMLCSTGET